MNLFKLIIEFIKQQIKDIGLGKYLLLVFLTILVSIFECIMMGITFYLFSINIWLGILGAIIIAASMFGIYKLILKYLC